jgi:hypothetical protein
MESLRGRIHRGWHFVALLLTLSALVPLPTHAADSTPALTLNGFYTLDISRSQGADVYYPSKSDDPSRILLRDGEFNGDFSLYGLQADLGLNENLSVTAQIVGSKQTKQRDYTPSVEWAYLSYDLGNDLILRGGKFKTPLLQGTELRYVGYSRLWVRPLIPSSGAGGFDDYQGLEFIKNTRLGNYDLRIQGAYGVPDHVLDAIEGKRIGLLSSRLGRDTSWVNLAVMHASYDIHTHNRLIPVVSDTGLLMGSAEAELWFDRTVINVGYARGIAKVSPDETMTYLSVGYRLDNLTPYALIHRRSMHFTALPSAQPPLPPPGAPPPIGAPPRARSGLYTNNAFALGFRYDMGASQAIKAQVERNIVTDDSYPQLGHQRSAATIFSVVLEGTF